MLFFCFTSVFRTQLLVTSVRSGIIKFLTFMVQGEGCCAAKHREINLRRTILSDTVLLSHSSTGFPGVTLSGSKTLLWHLYRITTRLQLMSSYISTSPSWKLMGSSVMDADGQHPHQMLLTPYHCQLGHVHIITQWEQQHSRTGAHVWGTHLSHCALKDLHETWRPSPRKVSEMLQ